ncbi:DUF885 domain-containing protein [Burkholderiaceae bacterium DAT-1]|nr:DUF885 domain-containing protein [Burkholderiaceae bacterium DAT-1]
MRFINSLYAGCAALGGLLATMPVYADAFDDWANRLAEQRMLVNPEGATAQQYFQGDIQAKLDAQLTRRDYAYRQQRVKEAHETLQALQGFKPDQLSPQQRISAGIIAFSAQGTVDADRFADYDFVFNQFNGLHVRLVNFLSQTHPIRNKRDIEHYLSRLHQVAEVMDVGIARAQEQDKRGILMPRFITTAAIGQFDRFLEGEEAANILVTSLKQRMSLLTDIPQTEQTSTLIAAERGVANEILPAFRRAKALLTEQLPHTTDDTGLWRFPDGKAAYAVYLHRMTTTSMDAEEIHALGLKEVARIEAQMDGLLNSLGYREGTIQARMSQLSQALQPMGEAPQQQLLDRYSEIVKDALVRATPLFDTMPKAPVVVKREPVFTEKTAAAHYSAPSEDGSRPGIFWVPLPGPSFRVISMRSLAYHEAIPGHHFQIALQQENPSLPDFRRKRVFGEGSAYVEGWALYAEQLAEENGWYEGDTVGLLGKLESELFRARRLVVDTGLHAMKWTRQQAIDYGITPVEVDRYVVNPGQACAYKIGMLKLLALRHLAQEKLGERFSIKAFHQLILTTGDVPLDVLETVVNDWISQQKSAAR